MNKKLIFTIFVSIAVICLVNSVCAHEAEYPEPYIDNPKINEVVSGDVDFNLTIDDHHETLYVNVTATHRQTNTVYFQAQDNNPTDGWSLRWDTSDAPNGKYYVSAVALNSKNLKGQYNILITLNNTKKDTNIVLDDSIAVVDKQNTIVAHLFDEASNPLSNKDVNVIIGEESFTTRTTADGVALVSFTPKEAKEYNVSAVFAGDNIYAPTQTAMVLNVLANSTLITVSDIVANNKEKIVLNANLKDYIGSSSNKELNFYIDNNKVGSALTDENGDAKLDYTISEVGGKHVYSVEYLDDLNATFKSTAFLYVPESSVYVKISAVTYSKDGIFTVGNRFKATYTVFNDGPDVSENTTFKYTVPDSLKYIEATSSKGNVSFANNEILWDMGDVSVGNESLEVEFEAAKVANNNLAPELSSATYDKSINNNITRNTLAVKSYKLTASDLTKYYTGSQKFKITLKDSDGKLISGATIRVVFNKNTIALKTNAKGYVELDTKNLKAGSYSIKASSSSLSISKKITVKPLLITKNVSKKKAATIKYTAKLVNNKGKIVKNKKITFKLKGKTYTAKTNAKGIATVSLKNLKVGKYTINTIYGKSSVKNTITVKK